MKKLFSFKGEKIDKIKNQFLLKHGAYTAALIAIVLVAVVAVNVLSVVISERFPTDIDLSSTGENSISKENIEYIRDVEKDVTVVVCASESGFTGEYMRAYALQNYATDANPSFFVQTAKLLSLYTRYNDKIVIRYADPDKASFNTIQQIVPETTLYYGDILVYCKFKDAEGKEVTNARVINFDDMYELVDSSGAAAYGMGYYTIATSKVETAVTSAIYAATSDKSNTVALLSGHSKDKAFDAIWGNLSLNNYNVVEVKDSILTKIPEEADIVALVAPKKDLAPAEIDVLEKFLENGGEKGKNLMVFCDGTKTGYPNLYDFLAEWGAEIEEGKLVYETNSSNQTLYSPTTPFLKNEKTDYTNSINNQGYMFAVSDAVPMRKAYTTFGNRVANVLISTYDSAVAAPMDADKEWEPAKDQKEESFAVAIYTHDTIYDADFGAKTSGVFVCSSVDFISSEWTVYTDVGNMNSVISWLDNACGRDTSAISFDQKVVEMNTFLSPSLAEVGRMRTIFVVLLPLVIMGSGIFVWIRRSRR